MQPSLQNVYLLEGKKHECTALMYIGKRKQILKARV